MNSLIWVAISTACLLIGFGLAELTRRRGPRPTAGRIVESVEDLLRDRPEWTQPLPTRSPLTPCVVDDGERFHSALVPGDRYAPPVDLTAAFCPAVDAGELCARQHRVGVHVFTRGGVVVAMRRDEVDATEVLAVLQ